MIRGCPVVSVLRFCASELYKVSRGEARNYSLGEHGAAGKRAARKSTIIQNRDPTKEGFQMC